MWWLGAAALVTGNVIIGRSRQGDEDGKGGGSEDDSSVDREGLSGGVAISDGVELGVKDIGGTFRDEVEEEEEEDEEEEE